MIDIYGLAKFPPQLKNISRWKAILFIKAVENEKLLHRCCPNTGKWKQQERS